MRRILKAAIAFIATATLPLIAVAPASAVTQAELQDITFDCVELSSTDYETLDFNYYGGEFTVTLTNCIGATIYDWNNTGEVETNDGTAVSTQTLFVNEATEVVTITGSDNNFEAWDESGTTGFDRTIHFFPPFDLEDPSGVQLADSSQVIPVDADEVTWGTPSEIQDAADNGCDASFGCDISINDIESCDVVPGQHVYATQTFTVSTAGEYTFRVTGTDPVTHYLSRATDLFPSTPIDDPMVALYDGAFDPTHPDSGIVGCNDDINDLDFFDDDAYDVALSQQDNIIDDHFPYFDSNLEPGQYTMVFTTWDITPADGWAAGSISTYFDDWTWDAADATVYFDVWGPEGGLELTDGILAETGVDPSFGLWTGLALVGTGVAITAARRRAARA